MLYVYVGIILAVLILIVLSSQKRIKLQYKKYVKQPNSSGYNGEDVANLVAREYGLKLSLTTSPEDLSDAYYPGRKMLQLSEKVCQSPSIASVAITCHELGHALQDNEKMPLHKVNIALQRITHFTNQFILPLLVFGLIFYAFKWPTENIGYIMCVTSGILFIMHALLKILVIPLEFNASKRAIKIIKDNNLLTSRELAKSRAFLNTAGQTYIAGLFQDIFYGIRKIIRIIIK